MREQKGLSLFRTLEDCIMNFKNIDKTQVLPKMVMAGSFPSPLKKIPVKRRLGLKATALKKVKYISQESLAIPAEYIVLAWKGISIETVRTTMKRTKYYQWLKKKKRKK